MKESDDNKKSSLQDDKTGKENPYNFQNPNIQNEQIRQSERAVERTLEDTRSNINKVTNEARREVSKSTDKMREYQEDSINIINNIANNYIESQKELFNSFSSSITDSNNRLGNYPQTSWLNYYSPERFAQIYGENVNTFTNSLIRYSNLLNNLTLSNLNYYKAFLQQMELYSKEFSEKQGRRT
jgi:hypothetical protein